MADTCLHCEISELIGDWFERNGTRQNGKPVIDIVYAIEMVTQVAVELAEMHEDRSARRRAFRFAHDALDAHLKSKRTGKVVPVNIPAEH